MMARKPASRVRAILELFRPLVDEIVLAADRTGDPHTLEECADLADKRFELDPAPLNRRIGWLHAQCDGDWIFRFDDDEAPAAALLSSLRSLTADRAPMQVAVGRRWLYGNPDRWITSPPWTPDYQIRLYRNTPGAWRFPGEMHAPITVAGELRLVDIPLYHCELLLADLGKRRKKRAVYEARRPVRRDGGFPVNWMYTPEDWPDVETAATPTEDLELIERVRSGARRPAGSATISAVVSVPEWEAERFPATREVSPNTYAARIQLVRPPATVPAGVPAEHEVVVENLGDESWPWGDYPPLIRLGYRWRTTDGLEIAENRCLFWETVEPRSTTRLMAVIEPPAEPGRYVLELDVVHENVRWFGCTTTAEMEVCTP